MDQVKIGKFISERRKKLKFTQQDLAEKLNITDRAISKWENGICLPDSGTMPELCELLCISINDLFSGEIVDMKDNEKKLEENLLEMTKLKEEKDKRLLNLEIVFGVICLIPLISSIIIVNVISMEELLRNLIVIMGVIPLLITTPFAILIEQKAGYYECSKCNHKYIPKYMQVLFAIHHGRTRYMKCPECGKKSWDKKVLK